MYAGGAASLSYLSDVFTEFRAKKREQAELKEKLIEGKAQHWDSGSLASTTDDELSDGEFSPRSETSWLGSTEGGSESIQRQQVPRIENFSAAMQLMTVEASAQETPDVPACVEGCMKVTDQNRVIFEAIEQQKANNDAMRGLNKQLLQCVRDQQEFLDEQAEQIAALHEVLVELNAQLDYAQFAW